MKQLPLEDTHAEIWQATARLRRRYSSLWLREHLVYTFTGSAERTRRMRLAASEALVDIALRIGGQRIQVMRVSDLSPAQFHRRFLATQTPVVFSGRGSAWDSALWTADYIADIAGDASVRLLQVAPNEPKGKPGEGLDVSYKDVARSMREGGDVYARFSGLLHERPELVADLDVEWFRNMRRDHRKFENWGFFMGGAGTATALHGAIAPNLFLQVSGEKRWYIYPCQTAGFFAPEVKGSPYFYSFVDVSDPVRWPIAEVAPGWVVDLEPGDILYVPPFAWHQVHNTSPTIAVGYRWMDVRQALQVSKVQTFVAATCTNPAPWKAKGHKDLPSLLDSIDY
jgi:hypothetical protein